MKYLIFFLFILIHSPLISHPLVNDLFVLNKQVLLEDKSKKPIPDSRTIVFNYWHNIQYFNNDLYVMNLENIEGNLLTGKHYKLHIYSEKGNKMFKVPRKKANFLFEDYYIGFAVSDNYLCILAQYYVYIYKIKNNGVKYLHKVPLDYYHSGIQLEGDKLIITMSKIVSQTITKGNHTNVIIYDIPTKKTLIKWTLPNPAGIEQSLFTPNNFITYRNGIFAVTDVTKYQIHFYDTQLILLETISHTPTIWKDIKDCPKCQEVMATFNPNTTAFVNNIRTLNPINPLFSTLRRINFINDTTMFVCIENQAPDYWDSEWYYDVWIKHNGKWDIKYSNYKANGTLNSSLLRFDCFYAGYIISDGKLLTTGPVPFILNKNDLNDQPTTKKRIDDFLINNPIKYSVFVYEFKD